MEQANYALATNCGLSAVTACLSLLKQGEHLITVDDVYGGTQRYLRKVFCPQTGIEWDMVDMVDLNNFKSAFKKNTKMVWVESPTNPTLKCLDIEKIAAHCKKMGALLVVDNTFMSPALQSPLKLGADICLHSITKYIGGHSDVLGGALIFNEEELYD